MKNKNINYQVVIPARGGSKRFPHKNIIPFIGKPLISHSIEFALKSFDKERIWVNTDDSNIEDVAKFYGIQITKRPEYLGLDTTSTAEVLAYQCEMFNINKIACDVVILLHPTNPLRPHGIIEDSINKFELVNRGSLASFSRLNRKFGKIENDYFKPTNYRPGQRMQTLIPEFFENGLIYLTKKEFLSEGKVITEDVYPLIYDGIESFVDIDEPIDLFFAEYVYSSFGN